MVSFSCSLKKEKSPFKKTSTFCCREMLLAQELYLKAVLTDTLALFGGLTVVFCLLKFTWKCWCGLRQFVLSEHWQQDLRTYGQWAGREQENHVNPENHLVKIV